jgi:hypothetical protein
MFEKSTIPPLDSSILRPTLDQTFGGKEELVKLGKNWLIRGSGRKGSFSRAIPYVGGVIG